MALRTETSRPQHAAATALLLFAGVMLAGCMSDPGSPASTGAKDTGTYPNLNIKPGQATEQLTPDQVASKAGELRAAQQANASQAGTAPNDVVMLRKIGETHAKEALDEIEAKPTN
ncbi:MAG TPA: hypothetical protein VIU14_08260 [Mesorhizobium sp.]